MAQGVLRFNFIGIDQGEYTLINIVISFYMINRTLEERLEELTERLNLLTIQQDSINEQVLLTRREVVTVTSALRDNVREAAAADTTRGRVSAVTGSGYYIGDQVVIINPSSNQENHGVVIGETRDGLLKIKPPLGKFIKRLPKNVRKDERSQSW